MWEEGREGGGERESRKGGTDEERESMEGCRGRRLLSMYRVYMYVHHLLYGNDGFTGCLYTVYTCSCCLQVCSHLASPPSSCSEGGGGSGGRGRGGGEEAGKTASKLLVYRCLLLGRTTHL